MKYGGKPGCAAKFFVVSGEGLQGIPDAVKHYGIDDFLISPGQVPKLFGKGEGNQVVLDWKQLVQLIFDPLLVFVILAMGAVSVTTGMGNISPFTAGLIGTLRQHLRAVLLPAPLHGPERLAVTGQN
jgi:hypothetical protein